MDKNKIYPDWFQAGDQPPKPEDFNAEGDLLVIDKGQALVFTDATQFIEEIIEKNTYWAKAPDKARFRESSEATDFDIATPEEMKVTTTDKEIAEPKKKEPILLQDAIKDLEAENEVEISEAKEVWKLVRRREQDIKDLNNIIKLLKSKAMQAGVKACEKCASFKEDYESMIELRNMDRNEHTRLQGIYSDKEDELFKDIEKLKQAMGVILK